MGSAASTPTGARKNNTQASSQQLAVPSNVVATNPFLRLISVWDVGSQIANRLQTKDFLALSNSHKSLQLYLKRARWDINSALRGFCRDPLEFRNLQARTSAIVGGQFALSFAEGKRSKGIQEMSIHIRHQYATAWKTYGKSEGWAVEDEKTDSYGSLAKRETQHKQYVKIYIVENPVDFMLTRSVYSFQLVFLMWDKAFVLFPWQTLQLHAAMPLQRIGPGHGGALRSYKWPAQDVFTVHWDRKKAAFQSPHQLRSIGDKHSLTIKLDTEGVYPPADPSPIELCEFLVLPQADGTAHFVFCLLEMVHLKHSYTMVFHDRGEGNGPLGAVCERVLRQVLNFKILALPSEQPPPWFDLLGPGQSVAYVGSDSHISDRWVPPSSWEHVDHLLHEWLQDVPLTPLKESDRPPGEL